jgi:hypothetical protein
MKTSSLSSELPSLLGDYVKTNVLSEYATKSALDQAKEEALLPADLEEYAKKSTLDVYAK